MSFTEGLADVLQVSQVTFTRLPPVDLPHTLEETLPDGETHEMPHLRVRLDHRNSKTLLVEDDLKKHRVNKESGELSMIDEIAMDVCSMLFWDLG